MKFIHSSQLSTIPDDAQVLGIEATRQSTIERCKPRDVCLADAPPWMDLPPGFGYCALQWGHDGLHGHVSGVFHTWAGGDRPPQRGLGNIDPQHGGSTDTNQCAALYCATHPVLPPVDATLITDRVDLDSVAAMAVLYLRVQGIGDVDAITSAHQRLELISAADSFDCGEWPGRRALPTLEEPWLTHGAIGDIADLAAPNWICGWATPAGGNRLTLEQAVRAVSHWLLYGMPAETGDARLRAVASQFQPGWEDSPEGLLVYAAHEARKHRLETIRAYESGEIRLQDAGDYFQESTRPLGDDDLYLYDRTYSGDVTAHNRLADLDIADALRGRVVITGVDGTRPAPASFAYCIAPISVVQQQDPRSGFARFSVSAFSESEWNRDATLANLTELEPGWGGSRTILGSPQDRDTKLTIEQVLEAIAFH